MHFVPLALVLCVCVCVCLFDLLNISSLIHSPLNLNCQRRLQVVRQARKETDLFMLCPDRLQRRLSSFQTLHLSFFVMVAASATHPALPALRPKSTPRTAHYAGGLGEVRGDVSLLLSEFLCSVPPASNS